jgi:hypothetical protein
MPGVLVVPVIPRSLYVGSTDTRICESVGFSFVCTFEKRTNRVKFFLRKHLKFDTMNVPVVYKGQMNKNLLL